MSEFTDLKSWTDHLGHSRLRSFTDKHNHFWLEHATSGNMYIGEYLLDLFGCG
jgi:hypothetical protein